MQFYFNLFDSGYLIVFLEYDKNYIFDENRIKTTLNKL